MNQPIKYLSSGLRTLLCKCITNEIQSGGIYKLSMKLYCKSSILVIKLDQNMLQ